MLTKRIIPCLDVDQGRVVKGVSFVNLRDAGNPVELASMYNREGADELVFLDITASSQHRDTIVEVVQEVSKEVFIPLTVGGGIRSEDAIRQMLDAGADKVSLNSAAVQDPSLIARSSEQFGSQCIVIAIDAKQVNTAKVPTPERDPAIALDVNSRWEVYTHGGRQPTGIDAVKWVHQVTHLGAGEILLTSMDADGHQRGYDLDLIRAVSEAVQIPVIASGGAGTLEHLYEAIAEGKADAVLAASIFHYGQYRIKEAKEYLAGRNIPIR